MEVIQIVISYDDESNNELFLGALNRINNIGYKHYDGYYIIIMPNTALHGIMLSVAVETAGMVWENWQIGV